MLLVDLVKTVSLEELARMASNAEAGSQAYWIIWDEIDERKAA
jgi:hypothetical protein